MPEHIDDGLPAKLQKKLLRMEVRAAEESVSELLRDKLAADAKIRALELEIERLGGESPERRKSRERNIFHSKKELEHVEEIYNREKLALENQLLRLVREVDAKEHEKQTAEAILEGLHKPIVELMIAANREAFFGKKLKTAVLSFILGVISSLAATWLWSVAIRTPEPEAHSSAPPAVQSPAKPTGTNRNNG